MSYMYGSFRALFYFNFVYIYIPLPNTTLPLAQSLYVKCKRNTLKYFPTFKH